MNSDTDSHNPKHNLPVQPTSFVGRESECADISALLNDDNCHLLTLVGPGGIGKTRLAIKVATQSLETISDGVFFVPLQPLATPDFLVSALADAINFSMYGEEDPKRQLLRYLKGKTMLIIMDNFEHLLEGVDLVADIVNAAPTVKILATSREALNLQEEWVRHIKGMHFPESEHVENIEPYSALKLFIGRARRVRGDFDEQACAIRVCRLVGGIPLAIELAASWLKTLTCTQIADEIQRNLDFLATNLRNVPERHRSIRAVFDHSWQLMSEDEQAVFKKLSVFRGGFQPEAAEEVAGASLLTLSTLVDKSLLRLNPSGRYEIHELLRQYAEERLQETPELQEHTQDRHCEYYARFLHQRESDLHGADMMQALQAIEGEIDNVRNTWKHAVEGERISEIRRSMESLSDFYHFRAWYQEGENAFSQAIEALQIGESTGERGVCLGLALAYQAQFAQMQGQNGQAKKLSEGGGSILRRLDAPGELSIALYFQGVVGYNQSDFRAAQALWEESLALATKLNDHFMSASASVELGISHRLLGKYREAEHFIQESLVTFQQLESTLGIATGVHFLGDIALAMGAYEKARGYYQESRSAYEEIESRWNIAQNLENLGHIAHALGEYEIAQERYSDCLVIAEEIGDLRRVAFSLIGLGNIAYALGELDQAQEHFQNSLAISNDIGQPWQKIRSLRGLGRVAYQQGNYAQSRQHYHESLTLCREIGVQLEIAQTLNELGRVAVAQRNDHEARSFFQDALNIGIEIQLSPVLLESFVGIADFFVAEGKFERAVELLSISLHHPTSHADTKTSAERLLAELEARLSADDFETAQARGIAGAPETIAVTLIAELSDVEHTTTSPQSHIDTLSARELEVLELIADGLSNREIARELVVTLGTVKKHINNIFGKLQVHSRTQAVAQARSLHLLP